MTSVLTFVQLTADDISDTATKVQMTVQERQKLAGIPDGGGSAGVSSFNRRTGEVMPADGDYTPAMVGAASATHAHPIGEITGLQTALDDKAPSIHLHAIGDVTGLQTALDGKAPLGYVAPTTTAIITASGPSPDADVVFCDNTAAATVTLAGGGTARVFAITNAQVTFTAATGFSITGGSFSISGGTQTDPNTVGMVRINATTWRVVSR